MVVDAFNFSAELWLHPGAAGWHFVTLPAELADDVRARAAGTARPFGSLPVAAAIGRASWATSLFADTTSASYLLPVKAEVRRREGISAGDIVRVTFELRLEGRADRRALGPEPARPGIALARCS